MREVNHFRDPVLRSTGRITFKSIEDVLWYKIDESTIAVVIQMIQGKFSEQTDASRCML